MAEYIEREAALAQFDDSSSAIPEKWARIRIEEIPAADVVPVVRCGEWVEENTRPRSSQFYCSVCHRTAYDPQPTRSVGWVKRCRYHYCPNCGALMNKDGDNDGV